MAMNRYAIERNVDFMQYARDVKASRRTWTNDRSRTLSKLIDNRFMGIEQNDADLSNVIGSYPDVIDSVRDYRESYGLDQEGTLPPGFEDAPSQRPVEDLQDAYSNACNYHDYGKYQQLLATVRDLQELKTFSDDVRLQNVVQAASERWCENDLDAEKERLDKMLTEDMFSIPEVQADYDASKNMSAVDYAKSQLDYAGGFTLAGEAVFSRKMEEDLLDIELSIDTKDLDEAKRMTEEKMDEYEEDGRDFEDMKDGNRSVFADMQSVQSMEDSKDRELRAKRLMYVNSIVDLCVERGNNGELKQCVSNSVLDTITSNLKKNAYDEKEFESWAVATGLPGQEKSDAEESKSSTMGSHTFEKQSERQATNVYDDGDFGG